MAGTSASGRSDSVPTIVWCSFLISPILFGVISWGWAEDSQNPEALSFSDPLIGVLCFAALLAFVLGSQGERLWTSLAQKALGARTSPALAILLVKLALFEFIALSGLVLSMLRSSFLVYMPFMFLALAGLLISRPGEHSAN